MIILIDNYDSFTYNIYHYLGELGAKVKVYRNDKITIEQIINLKPKSIILSPGPCTPDEAGICIDLVKNLYKKYSILGICLGHQSIGQAFGANIIKCDEIMHGKISKITHYNNKIFNKIKKDFYATRYHSLIIKNSTIHKDFKIIAKTKNNIIMGIAHKRYELYGLQFHPESIGSEDGKQIFKNYLKIINYDS
ncbi:MAG: Anthranilate synthase component 2 [Alphaproteobacteria bacterium MarineAlpha5_Bin9]|nr:MAG: Anthranilate synthase component 2 [Alphaproteobacteria bacterium MarineAlpha5_Bin9]|tara:strand:+ start:5189 stop:5767 length:579 start_codon:yes stop_codon:yes gene_type:complete